MKKISLFKDEDHALIGLFLYMANIIPPFCGFFVLSGRVMSINCLFLSVRRVVGAQCNQVTLSMNKIKLYFFV